MMKYNPNLFKKEVAKALKAWLFFLTWKFGFSKECPGEQLFYW